LYYFLSFLISYKRVFFLSAVKPPSAIPFFSPFGLFERWTPANEQRPESYDFFWADGEGQWGVYVYLRRGHLLNVNAAYSLPKPGPQGREGRV